MKPFSMRHVLVGIVMLAAAALTVAVTPTRLMADKNRPIELDKMIPRNFGQWHEIPQIGGRQVSLAPQTGGGLSEKIYDQSLLRTYRRQNGAQIMLSVAYGARQNNGLQVHRPEVCYVSQGFQILQSQPATLNFRGSAYDISRMIARSGARIEPVSYWIRIGDEVVRGGMRLKLAIVKAGLSGNIPDGILVRASTIVGGESDSPQAFQDQEVFLSDLLAASDPSTRRLLLGGGST